MSDDDQAIRDVVKGASVVYVGLFLELLIAFVAQILAARYLSVSSFGGLTTGTALLNVGAVVAALGFASGLTRYLPRLADAEKRSLTATMLGVTLVTSAVIGGAVTLGAPFIATAVFNDASVTVSVRIFGAAIPLAALLNVAMGAIRGQKESLFRAVVQNVAHPVVRFALIVVAILYGLGQAGLAGAYALPYVVSLALALALLHRSLPSGPLGFDAELTSRVARYSLPLTVSNVASFVYRSIDVFLVLHFMGSFAVGVYGVAYAAVSFMGMFSTAFNFIGSPVASELEHGGDVASAMRVFRAGARWLVVVSACALVPLGVFSTQFVTLIYGAKYATGGVVLTVLAVGFAAKNVLSIHVSILQALGRSRLIAFDDFAAAATNFGLNLLLIPRYGLLGAAGATLVAFVVRDGFATLWVRHETGETPLGWNVVAPTLVALPSLVGFDLWVAPGVPRTVPWLLGVSCLWAACYVTAVLVLTGLSDVEVMVLRSVEERYGVPLDPLDPLIAWLGRR